ncbi:MAG TPA: ABC transporter permease [Gemmatimonadaceae bacterium]|nr:ABC transporter permease [Gemmatimonadaceae bacterium]
MPDESRHAAPDAPARQAGRAGLARRLARDWRAVAALVVLGLLVLASLLGPFVWRADPDTLDLARAASPPGAGHPLGTDESGRDILSRLLVGGRVSLAVGAAAVLFAALVGVSLGALAGLGGRRADAVVMRFTDAMLSIPALFLVIAALTFFGTTIGGLVIAIGATSWMGLARLVRGELLAIREQTYVEAARALGAPPLRVLARHALPHLLPTAVVSTTFGIGTAILTESALSFLGFGVQPPTASWGNMLTNAQSYLHAAPWLAVYPGVLILLTVVAVNVLGDALRDATDPQRADAPD